MTNLLCLQRIRNEGYLSKPKSLIYAIFVVMNMGFTFLEAGMSRSKHVLHTLLINFSDASKYGGRNAIFHSQLVTVVCGGAVCRLDWYCILDCWLRICIWWWQSVHRYQLFRQLEHSRKFESLVTLVLRGISAHRLLTVN